MDNDQLTKIKITSLTNQGKLKLSDTHISINQEIQISFLKHLVWEPKSNWYGVTEFYWKGHDGFEYSKNWISTNLLSHKILKIQITII